MPGRPYILIASVGLSPQVVTELAQALADPSLGVVAEPRRPRAVHLITTRMGERFARALLLDQPGTYIDAGGASQPSRRAGRTGASSATTCSG